MEKKNKTQKKFKKPPPQEILSGKKSEHKKREEQLMLLSEKLAAEKETAQLYLDIAGVIIVLIGSDQKVKLANKKTCQILGFSEKQILGANWFDNFIPEHCRRKVRETFDKLMAGKTESAEYFENPVLAKSGKERLIAWRNTVLRDKKGAITGTLSSGSDITELKKFEESLMRSEEKYRSFFTSVPVGWAYCKAETDDKNKTEDYIFLEVNNAFETLTGLKKENILGERATKVIPKIKKTHWIEKFCNVAVTGTPIKGEAYLESFNKWFSIYVSCPQKGYFITVLEDISSRKKFEEALRKSEERYRILSENIPVVVYSALPDKYSTNIFLSGRAKNLTGYTADNFLSDPSLWNKIILDEDKASAWEAVKKHRADKSILHMEFRIKCKDGSVKWIKNMATPALDEHGRLVRIDGFMEDITERKEAEEILNNINKKLENIIEFLPDATVIIDNSKKIIAWNRAIEELTGVLKKDIIGKDHIHAATPFYGEPRQFLMDLLYKDNAELAAKYDFIEKKGDALYAEAFTPALFNNRGAYVWAAAAPLYDMDGNVIGAIESVRDITEHKKAEEELRRREKQLQTIFDASQAGIIQADPQGKITLANKRMAQMLGYTAEKMTGGNYIDHIPLSHKEYAEKLLRNLTSGRIESIDTEMPHIKEDGAKMWGHVSARRTTNADGSLAGLVFIISDITERKTLEEDLLHAQKMESVGQLTGGIAHEFNNILTAIIGFGSLLQMKMKNDDPLLHHVKKILESSNKAAELTHNLLSFSRKQAVNLKPVDLNEIIAHAENFLKRLVGENIEFEIKKSKDELNILADTGHIQQAIINLAINAKEAMPGGGHLIISSEPVEIDRRYIQVHGHGQPGHYALLSVTDTGAGMSREIQGKIFDPFFTTKETGKAPGLGLATVYGIVKQHKGFINVYSEAGKGTCFRIYLPLTQIEKIQESESSVRCSLFGAETVLMAEDDAYLAKLSETVLAEFGYRPIMAANGEEAVKKFMENKDQIDVCIFDVIMPKKSGIDAYNEIKKIKPGVKVFFISGYASDIMNIDRLPEEGLNMLSKPFRPDELLIKIREILAK